MASSKIPPKMKQILVKTLGTNFRKVTEVIDVDVPKPGPEEVLVRNSYVGVNATDVNFVAGRHTKDWKTPFPCGFEALGEVVQAGAQSDVKEGETVVYLKYGAYAEFVVVPAAEVIPVPSSDPALMSIVVNGVTASISLEKKVNLKAGQTILVTGAAGGTGQFAVQLAKAAGCHVVGTCSNDTKVEFIKSIGCDRPINYKKEKLDEVLSKEYPKGLDVVFECIGNEVFKTAFKNIAIGGHLILIGMISGYLNDSGVENKPPADLLWETGVKNVTLSGFSLDCYVQELPKHFGLLTQMYTGGRLKIAVDKGSGKTFKGLEAVADGVEYLHSSKNIGKVVVTV